MSLRVEGAQARVEIGVNLQQGILSRIPWLERQTALRALVTSLTLGYPEVGEGRQAG